MAKILSDSEIDIARAGALLRAGELVAVPTETVYGLAGDAFSERAVRAIFAAKNRPFFDPLIVHVRSLEQAGTIADISHPFTKKLADAFWPGPLTLVLPKKDCVPEIVTAGAATIAVRAPAHPLMRKILAAAGIPLAAPSANPFGYVSPTCAEHVQESLGRRIGWIVDGGTCSCGVESTIVLVADKPRLLRPGVITREQLERVLGVPVASEKSLLEKSGKKSANADAGKSAAKAQKNAAAEMKNSAAGAVAKTAPETAETPFAAGAESTKIPTPQAPGMLKKHYSPTVPVELFENGAFPKMFVAAPTKNSAAKMKNSDTKTKNPTAKALNFTATETEDLGRVAFVFQSRASRDKAVAAARIPADATCFLLSESGAQEDVARNVFAMLRRLDNGDFSKVFVEKSPSNGIGVAVNDRLLRAAVRVIASVATAKKSAGTPQNPAKNRSRTELHSAMKKIRVALKEIRSEMKKKAKQAEKKAEKQAAKQAEKKSTKKPEKKSGKKSGKKSSKSSGGNAKKG